MFDLLSICVCVPKLDVPVAAAPCRDNPLSLVVRKVCLRVVRIT